jgi:hypothetical protein
VGVKVMVGGVVGVEVAVLTGVSVGVIVGVGEAVAVAVGGVLVGQRFEVGLAVLVRVLPSGLISDQTRLPWLKRAWKAAFG